MFFVPKILGLLLIAPFLLGTSPAWGDESAGVLSGRIACGVDQPCRGVASLWDAQGGMPDPRKFIIVPKTATQLHPDGSFLLQAPPGEYYLGALLRRTDGPAMGPPRPGDLVFMTPTVDGEGLLVKISATEKSDVGTQSASWVYRGFEKEFAMGVLGRVVDDAGQPLSGMLVFAFADAEMSGSAWAVSEPTDAAGEFRLRLDRPGTIYLRTRKNYGGGAPIAGEAVGVYGGSTPAPVILEQQQIRQGLIIETIKVPEVAGPSGRQQERKPD